MSKHLQGVLSSVTKISNDIVSSAFSNSENVHAIEVLLDNYLEKVDTFKNSFEHELEKLQKEESDISETQTWFDDKMAEIDSFVG